jgi:melanoma-associated antigen
MNSSVFGSATRRGAFNQVFDEAQLQLRHVFGMEMTELPAKEKVTIAQKRAAAQKSSSTSATKSWILTSTLSPKYRDPAILLPPRVPTAAAESSYTALYTFIISLIFLSGGTLPSTKLERYLRRANADESTPVASTEKLIQRLCKDGYIVKIKDTSSGEEMIDYIVGPRGRVEVGEDGVKGLVTEVYGKGADEDLARKVERSLAVGRVESRANAGPVATNGVDGGNRRTRPARNRRGEEEEEDEGHEEDSD